MITRSLELMARALPQRAGVPFITDGGLETTLIFRGGFDLPHFAAFVLLDQAVGRVALKAYYDRYLAIAAARGVGFILESPTWRASRDWGARLGYDPSDLERVNRDAIALMVELRTKQQLAPTTALLTGRRHTPSSCGPIVVSGCIGPRGDGYVVNQPMSPAEARDYHGEQVRTFADTAADSVTAITMASAEEATGITQAARAARIPVVISYTVETDGRLPSGMALRDAIETVDRATGAYPAYYMINCAHPEHFANVVSAGGAWLRRIQGLRANASRLSHAELDAADTLDDGDPDDLARSHLRLLQLLPRLNVLGGCCGTDERHVRALADRCFG